MSIRASFNFITYCRNRNGLKASHTFLSNLCRQREMNLNETIDYAALVAQTEADELFARQLYNELNSPGRPSNENRNITLNVSSTGRGPNQLNRTIDEVDRVVDTSLNSPGNTNVTRRGRSTLNRRSIMRRSNLRKSLETVSETRGNINERIDVVISNNQMEKKYVDLMREMKNEMQRLEEKMKETLRKNDENEKELEKLDAITVCHVCFNNYTEVQPG